MEISYYNVIHTVRSYFKFFRKSPLKLATLNENVKAALGKTLALKLDCKTRWNSVLPMLKRFIEIKEILKLTIEEFGGEYNEDFEQKSIEIISALEPLEEGIKKLSSQTSNLLVAEATCIYILKSLGKQNNDFAERLQESLKTRIVSRRKIELISTLKFLHSGEFPKDNQFFNYSTKASIKKKIKEINSSLFNSESEVESVLVECVEESLLSEINSFMDTSSKQDDIDLDIKAFQGTKQRTQRLNEIYMALLTMQATSTDTERTFSVAGNFKTKLRNRLSGEKLNVLVFLKYHFLTEAIN